MITSFESEAMQSEVQYVNDIHQALTLFKKDLEKLGGAVVQDVGISSKNGTLLVTAIIQFSASTLHECLVQQGLLDRDTP
jgi:hypothetical protein